MKKSILVLGASGMLGSMVYDYLSKHSRHRVEGTTRRRTKKDYRHFDAINFLYQEKKYQFLKYFNYLVNCIGIIKPYCEDNDPEGIFQAISINALFPYRLSRFLQGSKTKVIQITTDCVYSGKSGNYYEDSRHDSLDVYGKTKSLGEVIANNFLNIRCSIIGFESGRNVSLLGWFLSQKNGAQLKGYAHHKWNGITTLQFAQLCQSIIDDNSFDQLRKTNHVYHYHPNKAVNKFELLKIFADVFCKDYVIEKVSDVGEPIDRTLSTRYSFFQPVNKISMKKAVKELRDYSQRSDEL